MTNTHAPLLLHEYFFLKKILLRENIEYNNIAMHTDELLDPFQMTSVGVPYHRGVD